MVVPASNLPTHAGPVPPPKNTIDEDFRHAESGWRFRAVQSPMLESQVAETIANDAGIWPHPCMIFDTFLQVYDAADNLVLDINTRDALRGTRMDLRQKQESTGSKTETTKTAGVPELKVVAESSHLLSTKVVCQHAEKWGSSRDLTMAKQIETDTDWTFSSTYCPTVMNLNSTKDSDSPTTTNTYETDESLPQFSANQSLLPMALLTQQQNNPIEFFTAITFYEDELDDEGSAAFSLKIRVHKHFFFLLLQNEIRVDNVLARKVETRYFGNLCFMNKETGNKWNRGIRLMMPEGVVRKSSTGGQLGEKNESEVLVEQSPNYTVDTSCSSPAKEVEQQHSVMQQDRILEPGSILREWSYSEVSFPQLRQRGDLNSAEEMVFCLQKVNEKDLICIANMSGSGRKQTCDHAHFTTHKNPSCRGSKSCRLSLTKMGHLSCGFGIAEASRNL
ncbi:unnamed protein product [Amoebophrya sp. A120]|nr:unnamed protein product [Amoebophrya sp. A120]|eukprot:GSA120T00023177001.1